MTSIFFFFFSEIEETTKYEVLKGYCFTKLVSVIYIHI